MRPTFHEIKPRWKSLRSVALGAVFVSISVAVTGCGNGEVKKSSDSADLLVMVGDSVLTRQEVEARIPGGLSEADSSEMFDAIVRGWVQRLMLDELGRDNIDDMERIDRLTEQYRSRLIAEAYRRKVSESGQGPVPTAKIDEYYAANAAEMVLDSPILKGLFLKVKTDDPDLEKLKGWIFAAGSPDIDNLDKYELSGNLQYTFFEDRWVDWNQVAEKIPERIADPDLFLASRKNFEMESDGNTYLLHVSSYVPSGSRMPKEYAEPFIASILETEAAQAYEQNLLASLYRKARSEGRLRLFGFKKPLF